MSNVPVVRVNRKAAERVEAGHPWIFSSDVTDRGQAQPGDAVRVVHARNQLLGTAHYSSASLITLRMLSRRLEPIGAEFIESAVASAYDFRKRVVRDSNAYRLIHGEADSLPGLVVDRYADALAVQFLTQGMDRLEAVVVDALQKLVQPQVIIARNDVAVRSKEALDQNVRILKGTTGEPVEIHMNGLRLVADLQSGQKTGVYLDQRENYVAVQKWAHGRALDCFSGSGGFALHLAARCETVEAIDSSSSALATARQNAAANNIANVRFEEASVLDYLPSLISARRRFDLVIIDPPAFTKSRSALDGALKGYKELNLRALRLLERGGILVSCSCSHHLSEARLLEVVAQAALDAGKQLRVLERRTQALDHPILLTVPETHYLKCLIFEVL